MHELSIISSVVDTVTESLAAYPGARVLEVRLRVGALAHNLSDLYDYMMRQLLRAIADNNVEYIREVSALLAEIRTAWVAIGPQVSQVRSAAGRGG